MVELTWKVDLLKQMAQHWQDVPCSCRQPKVPWLPTSDIWQAQPEARAAEGAEGVQHLSGQAPAVLDTAPPQPRPSCHWQCLALTSSLPTANLPWP